METCYSDWWNANNIAVFWSSWNLPVHVWAVRHVYIPMTTMGYSKSAASIVVFFISAFFHEYLVMDFRILLYKLELLYVCVRAYMRACVRVSVRASVCVFVCVYKVDSNMISLSRSNESNCLHLFTGIICVMG